MDPLPLLARLEAFPAGLRAVCAAVGEVDEAWRPAGEGWCLREVVAHLADEEVEDFPARLELLLAGHEGALPPIDPEGWVLERAYAAKPVAESLERFARARSATVARLRARLNAPDRVDWSRSWSHPRLGDLRAGDLLGALAAHDALHLRQVARLLHGLAERDAAPWQVGYAGGW